MANVKIKSLDKEVALEITQDFFQQFEYCINESQTPTFHDLEKFLSKNFHLTINGKEQARSLNEYISSLQGIRQKYSHLEFDKLNVDVLSSGYQIMVRYTVKLTPRQGGKSKEIEFLAVATLEDHLFTTWDEIANLHGASPLTES
jgi:hypothetical protein